MTIKAINTIMKEGFLSNRVASQLCFSLCNQTGMECGHPALPVDVVSKCSQEFEHSREENLRTQYCLLFGCKYRQER